MSTERSATLQRFALSYLIALPITIALLYLMTRLILPTDQDPIVTRMIRNIELQRIRSTTASAGIHIFERPAKSSNTLQPDELVENLSRLPEPAENEVEAESDIKIERKEHVIDWWAEARKLSKDSDHDAFQDWLIKQGYVLYVSIMQGASPITNGGQGTSLPADREAREYKNVYGELEIRINDNCVMQISPTGLDYSDFDRHLPARVFCKSPPKAELTFHRQDRE